MGRSFYIVCLFWGTLVISCAPTQQARDVGESGFLVDYSRLTRGGSEEALYVYRNPAARFSKYDKVLIEPVTVWKSEGSSVAEVPEDDLQNLADLFYRLMREQLEKDYQIVDEAGPGTMRLRVAITEAEKANVVLNVLSTVTPLRIFSSSKSMATGTHAFVGKAGAEGELTDSETGQVLIQAVDRRAGANSMKGATSSWGDVEQALRYWAERIRTRLAVEREAE